jgi:hypothetical protein
MKPATIDAWVWLLIYGGLLLACLGWFVARIDPGLGWVLGTVGGVALVAGVLLIVVRSRMGP